MVVFVQIIPEIKRRQIKRWLDDYEATLREKARAGGRPGATGEVAARVNSRQGVATQLGVYALLVRIEQRGLVDVEKVPSEKGPPRKVYSLYAQGREYLEEFWRT